MKVLLKDIKIFSLLFIFFGLTISYNAFAIEIKEHSSLLEFLKTRLNSESLSLKFRDALEAFISELNQESKILYGIKPSRIVNKIHSLSDKQLLKIALLWNQNSENIIFSLTHNISALTLIEMINSSLAKKLKTQLLPSENQLTLVDLTRQTRMDSLDVEFRLQDNQVVLIHAHERAELEKLHRLVRKFWEYYKAPITAPKKIDIRKHTKVISHKIERSIDNSVRNIGYSLLEKLSLYYKNNLLKGLKPHCTKEEFNYLKNLDSAKFFTILITIIYEHKFNKLNKLLSYIKSYSHKEKLFQIFSNYQSASNLTKLSIYMPYFFEDYFKIFNIENPEHVQSTLTYDYINTIVSSGSDDWTHTQSMISRVRRFSWILNTLTSYYDTIHDNPLKLHQLIDPKIYAILDGFKDVNMGFLVAANDLIDIFKHINLVEIIPNNLTLRKILFLEDILDMIENNPYSKDILHQLNTFQYHELLSGELKINSYINELISLLSNNINSEEYQSILIDFKRNIIIEQSKFLNSLSVAEEQNLTHVLFTQLIREVFLKPHAMIQKEYPNSPSSDFLRRSSRLFQGIIDTKREHPSL